MKRVIQAHIFDADGCIFTDKLVTQKKSSNRLVYMYDQNAIKDAHAHLFEFIAAKIKEHLVTEIIVSCGSNRQCFGLDEQNAAIKQTGFFYPVLKQLANIIKGFSQAKQNASFILLYDVLLDLNPGTTFDFAMKKIQKL